MDEQDVSSVASSSSPLAVLCVLVISAVVAIATYASTAHTPPFSDEVAYFSESIWIAEHGGFSGFLQACFSGDYPFYTRNPGLPLLMSTLAERSLEMVRPARLFQVMLAWAALVAMFAVARRSIGDAWAAGWTLIIAASYPWLSSAATLTVEPLFFALAFFGWYAMCVREQNEGVASRHWFATGAILGIAYWFKASILLLGATVVVSAPVYWIAMIRKRPSGTEARAISSVVCLVIAGFVLVTWPLLLERFVAKGNPFFLNSAPEMWMDHWEQHHIMYQGLAEFSLSQWFATHTVEQAWQRLLSGLLSQFSIASAFFSAKESPHWLARCVGTAVLLLSVRGAWLLPRPFARFHTLCFGALSFGSLSWNIHTQTARLSGFLAPIIGFLATRFCEQGRGTGIVAIRSSGVAWSRGRSSQPLSRRRVDCRISSAAAASAESERISPCFAELRLIGSMDG